MIEKQPLSCESLTAMETHAPKRINEQLKQKTGIDFSRYRDPELVEAIGNAITFPLFLVRSLTRPVGFMLLLLVLAILIANSGYFRIWLTFPGVLLAIINGIALGLVLLIRRIRNDMKKVFAISADLSLQVLRDIESARNNISSSPGSFPGMLEIFQGVNANVILPAILQTLDRKIPFLGKFIGRLTERFFNAVNSRLGRRLKTQDANEQPPAQASPA
ncbi:MAG: hypothetical protein WBS20_05430, partial [Lysobacterales bacterium]